MDQRGEVGAEGVDVAGEEWEESGVGDGGELVRLDADVCSLKAAEG